MRRTGCASDTPATGKDGCASSAMAHLNLVMIHPFRDGNGRMARALATSVLTRSDIGEPEFSSIEEWLGVNTEDYHSVLAHTGHGSWQPRDNAQLWLTFNLRAHHMQAQTVARRVREADLTWTELDQIASDRDLPDRVIDAMFDAVLGYRVRRATLPLRPGEVPELPYMATTLAWLGHSGLLAAYALGDLLARLRIGRCMPAAAAGAGRPQRDLTVRSR